MRGCGARAAAIKEAAADGLLVSYIPLANQPLAIPLEYQPPLRPAFVHFSNLSPGGSAGTVEQRHAAQNCSRMGPTRRNANGVRYIECLWTLRCKPIYFKTLS